MNKLLSTLMLIFMLALPPLALAATQNGTITTNGGSVAMPIGNNQSVAARITGTWTGTLAFEVSNDLSNWDGVDTRDVSAKADLTTITANNYVTFNDIAGSLYVRVRSTAFASGTATITLSATFAGGNSSSGGGAVTNAGTFVVQEDGAALTALEKIDDFISGSEGQVDVITSALPTGASTSAKQLADGHNVTIDNASIAVTGTFFQGTQPISGTVTANLGGVDNAVLDSIADGITAELPAGLLHANSPQTEATIVKVFNAGDIAATSMGASTAINISGTGALTKVCVILTTGTITTAEDGDLIFFTTDPTISENTADLTVVKAKQISSIISLTGTDFTTDFATAQVNCQKVDEPFTAITHVLWHAKGATAYTDEVIDVLVTYRRDS